ncbi:major facilitator superfamily domain-containing protein [Xylogone sp. PMI_703]|nr:major facilitator superfamily domain-containing protein [Xylogone sp. PMI_703]
MQYVWQKQEIAKRLKKWAEEQRTLPGLNDDAKESPVVPTTITWDDFDSDLSPRNWRLSKKLAATGLVTAIAFAVQYASAVDSAVAEKVQAEFGVSAVVESLATGLFLVGFAIGAPVAGPLSEIAGRNPVYIISLVLFMLCTMGAGLAQNIGTQIVMRFLAGVFGSPPLVCAGGTVSDLWTPFEQIYVFPVYATGGFLGLAIGPAIGGVIGESTVVGWRWVEWSTLVISGVVLLMVLVVQPETYEPVLLGWKKQMIAEMVGSKDSIGGTAKEEVRDVGSKIAQNLYRPFQLVIHEPIIIMISLYLSVLYIIVFTFLPGYTFIFTLTYGYGFAARGLSFLALGVGFLSSLILVIPVAGISRRQIDKTGELSPESRLYYAMCGAPMVPIAAVWIGWTARSSISPWSAICASALLGFGVLCIFFSSYQYIIHTYKQYAASGLVFITLTRYLAAGGMVTVGIPMYGNLGVSWTLTVLGSISALLVPVPYCLFWYGPSIRKWSKYSSV